MCHVREEGGGPREAMYSRLRTNIRQNTAEIVALEATIRRRLRQYEALSADVAASARRLAQLQAESLRLAAELKRSRARVFRYKFLSFLAILSLFLLGFSLTVLLKKALQIDWSGMIQESET